MSDDGRSGEPRQRLARGTAPRPVAGREAASGASLASGGQRSSDEPARSIQEAVERLIDAVETEDAVAEWTRGGS